MKKLKFPSWSVLVGIAMTLVSLLLIPIVAILHFFGLSTWRTWQNPLSLESPMRHATQTLIVNGDARTHGDSHEMNGNTRQNGETYL